jgi:hypothetical protein
MEAADKNISRKQKKRVDRRIGRTRFNSLPLVALVDNTAALMNNTDPTYIARTLHTSSL